MRFAKIVRFKGKRANVGIDLYNITNSNTPTNVRSRLQSGPGTEPMAHAHRSGAAAVRPVQRAVRLLSNNFGQADIISAASPDARNDPQVDVARDAYGAS